MKKTIMILSVLMIGLTSCKKEDIKPKEEQVEEVVDCNCGIATQIISDGVSFNSGGVSYWYRTRIKNLCSNNMTMDVIWRLSSQPKVYIGDTICYNNPW